MSHNDYNILIKFDFFDLIVYQDWYLIKFLKLLHEKQNVFTVTVKI